MIKPETLKKEIEQGIRNKYQVVVNTVDGKHFIVKEFLNYDQFDNTFIKIKCENGMVLINAEVINSVIYIDSDIDLSDIIKSK